jgi:ubiquinone/menaquinone biosynthesis C-methylase UbiE
MEKSQNQPAAQPENTYVVDAESSAEMARLMRQEQLITEGMGGLFPEGIDLLHADRILDIACGPGGWVIETAFAYPHIEVIGVDISHRMITYAQAQANAQGLTNASFAIMNAMEPLDFPDNSFDVVNARLIVAFMLPEIWPAFVRECVRILRPGGIVRFTDLEWGFSNKPAFEQMSDLASLVLSRAGRSFSQNGTHLALIAMLRRFVQDAGCTDINKMAHIIEFSSGTEAHDGFYHDMASAFKLLQPFIIKWQVATQEELDQIYQQMLFEMQEDDFCAVWVFLTVWGHKPLS